MKRCYLGLPCCCYQWSVLKCTKDWLLATSAVNEHISQTGNLSCPLFVFVLFFWGEWTKSMSADLSVLTLGSRVAQREDLARLQRAARCEEDDFHRIPLQQPAKALWSTAVRPRLWPHEQVGFLETFFYSCIRNITPFTALQSGCSIAAIVCFHVFVDSVFSKDTKEVINHKDTIWKERSNTL